MWPVCVFSEWDYCSVMSVTLSSLPGKFKCSLLNSFLVLVELLPTPVLLDQYIYIYIGVCVLYCHLQHHYDTINKPTQEDFFKQNIYLSLYCKGSKGLLKVCGWEGVRDRTELKYFDPNSYGRQRCVFLVLQMLNRRPWGPLCKVLAFFTASYQHLLWTPIQSGHPRAPSAGCGFFLPQLFYLLLQLYCDWTRTLSWLSYIIVQRPLDHPLYLWNRMLDRRQAEITVM